MSLFDKALNYGAVTIELECITTRRKVRGVFDRHDFSFKWSFAEFDGAHNLSAMGGHESGGLMPIAVSPS